MTSDAKRNDNSLIWKAVVASFALSLYGIIAIADQPTVQRPDLSDARATFSALHQLAQAEVSIERGDESTRCSWDLQSDRHVCGSEAWNFVGVYNGRAAGRAQRCLWVHPNSDGAITRLRWDDVELGATASATLMLLQGAGSGDTVHMRLRIDDKFLVAVQTTREREVHNKDAVLAAGRDRGSVVIEVSAHDNRWRLACLRLVLNGNRAAPGGPDTNATTPATPHPQQRAGRGH